MRVLAQIQRYGRLSFLVASAAVVALFLYFSNSLIGDLAVQERERMQIWADATKEIISSASGENPQEVNIDFLLKIIQSNTTIPVLLTDDGGNILDFRNFTLPEPGESAVNSEFLQKKLRGMSNRIDIEIEPGLVQHLYYEDSTLLKRMSVFPYIQLAVMLAFIAVVYFAVLSTKKAEQNKVWVGLSKETAHQLGTPISSLMAWMELLPDMGVDADTIAEMNKDVGRLSTIAARFSKIGSVPKMEPEPLGGLVEGAVDYMSTRISSRIHLVYQPSLLQGNVEASRPLLEWVIENLIKNAVDAMDGAGSIKVSTGLSSSGAYIEVSDTGKGIARKDFRTVFNPGYTTKSRGWGLGLTLAKRIVEQYHGGRIYVKSSIPGQGTNFRIDLPTVSTGN